MFDNLKVFLNVLYVLNVFFAFIIIFYERRNPASTWAWLMVIVLLPYAGFIAYLIFGLDSRKHRVFYEKYLRDTKTYNEFLEMGQNTSNLLNEQLQIMSKQNILNESNTAHFNDLIYLNFVSANSLFTNDNEMLVYNNGNAKFEAMLADILAAKSHIHLLYYIFRNDELGRKVIEALRKKALEGVEVKLCVDGMGNFQNPKSFYKQLIEAGGMVEEFMSPHFIRMNFRNHRKICVIDGEIAYIGGLNVGNEYLGKVKRFGHWRDSHLRIIGSSVNQLQIRFIMDWNFCVYSNRNHKKNKKLSYNTKNYENRILPISENYFSTKMSTGSIPIQIVSSGPDTKWSSIKYGYNKMITEADKRIYIETPYFIPDDSIFESLKISALSGNDVRIIIPANPDHMFVYGAAISYLSELMECGVRCYKYERGFVHSKMIITDGLITSIGTANMDIRSFKLNFETNAFIYDRKISEKFEEQFLKDLEDCTEIDQAWCRNRSIVDRIKGPISRLLSPLL